MMTNKEKIELIENTIKLLNKACAENAYDGIVMPNMPQIVLKQLQDLKAELIKESSEVQS